MNSKNLKAFTAFAAAFAAAGAVGFIFADPKTVKALEDEKLIEGNPAVVNPANATEYAFRLTELGQQEAAKLPNGGASGQQAPTTDNAQSATPTFVIKSGIALPKIERAARGGGAGSKYPVDQLQPGQSFFIPAPAGMKSPSKTFGSMVATKNKQYGDPADGKDFRRFTVRTVTGDSWDQPGVKGVAIYRLDTAGEAAAKADALKPKTPATAAT